MLNSYGAPPSREEFIARRMQELAQQEQQGQQQKGAQGAAGAAIPSALSAYGLYNTLGSGAAAGSVPAAPTLLAANSLSGAAPAAPTLLSASSGGSSASTVASAIPGYLGPAVMMAAALYSGYNAMKDRGKREKVREGVKHDLRGKGYAPEKFTPDSLKQNKEFSTQMDTILGVGKRKIGGEEAKRITVDPSGNKNKWVPNVNAYGQQLGRNAPVAYGGARFQVPAEYLGKSSDNQNFTFNYLGQPIKVPREQFRTGR